MTPIGADYVVAMDVGGTTIKTLLVTETGQELGRRRSATPGRTAPGRTAPGRTAPGRTAPGRTSLDDSEVVEGVLQEAQRAVQFGRDRTGRPALALAVATLGLVDETTGVALHSAALGWRDVPLRAMLAARTGLPVVLGQDLRAAALAEAQARAGSSFLFVAIGTGVGAALVRDGAVDAGKRGLAGELGHIQVPAGRSGDGRPRRCGCGAYGCLETEASATALVRGYRDRTGRTATAAEVAQLARVGDDDAVVVWDDLLSALTWGLVAATALLDPGQVIFGGGVALAGAQLIDPLQTRLADRYRLAEPPALSTSVLGDQAAGLGAGVLGWQYLRSEGRTE